MLTAKRERSPRLGAQRTNDSSPLKSEPTAGYANGPSALAWSTPVVQTVLRRPPRLEKMRCAPRVFDQRTESGLES